MPDFGFLPDFPAPVNALMLFGALLLAGLAGGSVLRRLQLPAITGYVMAGMLLGKTGLGWLTADLLVQARVFVDISLGLVLFELGRRLDLQWLRRDRFLLFASLSESALSFTFIYITLYYFEVPALFAAIAAAIGISSSPAVLMLIARERRAEGQITERALALVAVNNVLAFVIVAMLLSALHYEYQASAFTILLHPLYLLIGSTLLGLVAGKAAIQFGRWLGPRVDAQFVLIVAFVVVTVGLAAFLKLSVLLALLVAGITIKNMDRRYHLIPIDMGSATQLFFVVLFVITGAFLDAKQLLAGGAIAVVYVLARTAGKVLGVMPWAMLSGFDWRRSALLGTTLVPMAGFAVVLMQDVWLLYPELNQQALAIMTSVVLMLELIGPVLVQRALQLAGETEHQRP